MEHYRLMERWLKTIQGCVVWHAMVMSAPGAPSTEQIREVEAWMDRTMNRIRDEATEF